MTLSNVTRAAGLTLVASLAAAALAGCTAPTISADRLAQLQSTLASCPANSDEAVDVRIDESGSRRELKLTGADRQAVSDALTRAAICGHGRGRFRVDVFSSSIASSANVVDATLGTTGATDIARLRKVPRVVDVTMTAIDNNFGQSVNQLTDGGTDLPAQFFAAKEFLNQVNADKVTGSPNYRLRFVLLTDGESNSDGSFIPEGASPAVASALAAATPVPDLRGSSILVAGVGLTSESPRPSSTYVSALKTFLVALSKRSGSSDIAVVTDYSAMGR